MLVWHLIYGSCLGAGCDPALTGSASAGCKGQRLLLEASDL
jgi:hypothetical protein